MSVTTPSYVRNVTNTTNILCIFIHVIIQSVERSHVVNHYTLSYQSVFIVVSDFKECSSAVDVGSDQLPKSMCGDLSTLGH